MFLSWPATDRDKAIWQYIRARQACGSCGTRAEEWDPRRGGHPGAYIPEAYRCEGCHQVHTASEKLAPAMHVRLVPNPDLQKVVKRREENRRP